MRRGARSAFISAGGGLVLLALLLAGGTANADHSGGLQCYACHDLNGNNVEPGTNLLSSTAMTEMKTHGWKSGLRVGCTFCHRSVNAPAIPDVLGAFSGATPPGDSRHPVARNFVTNAIDNTPYLSTDNTSFPQNLDCSDCHDKTLVGFPNHDQNWLDNVGAAGRTKATNPFALKNVTAPKAYDDLCRACHGRAGAFAAFTGKPDPGVAASRLLLSTHDNADAGRPIRDTSGMNLRTQDDPQAANRRQCAMCHDSHESTNLHLFSDGTEKDFQGGAKAAINELVDCTNVCHYRGDPQGNFDRRGHGKPTDYAGTTLAMYCTDCHSASQPHRPSDPDYFVKYRFRAFDNSWLNSSAFSNRVKSVCARCHGTHPLHNTARGQVGCLDCHDPHAKNSDNNVMMVPSTNRVANPWGVTGAGATVGSEAVLFQKSQRYPGSDNVTHYYTNVGYGTGDPASPGFCDQRACHGAGTNGGVPLTPLSTYLSSGKHSGGNQSANTNCEACHTHVDTAGSFRASASCTLCHGQPPPPSDSLYPYNENFTAHLRHAGSTGTNPAYYQITCQKCHANYTDPAYHNTRDNPAIGVATYQSVFFENSVKRGAAAYENATLSCANIYCHSDGRGGNPIVNPVKWYDPLQPGTKVALNCAGCHGNDNGFPAGQRMASGAHTTHLNQGYLCSACHAATVSDVNQVLAAGAVGGLHVNGVRDVAIKPVYAVDGISSGHWDNATATCSGITCHGGNPVKWTDIGLVTCASCHLGTGDVDDFGTGTAGSFRNGLTARIDNNEWTWSGHGRASGTYDRSGYPAAAFGGTNPCLYCHDSGIPHDNAGNIFRLKDQTGAGYAGLSWNATCLVCHSKTSAPPGYNYPGGPGVKNSTSAGTRVDTAHYGAKHGAATDNGGAFCFDCHDPHGDRSSAGAGNIFMIGKRVTMGHDNATGIPTGGNDNSHRPAVSFTDNATGANYADNTARQGICQVCHTTGLVSHWTNSAPWSDGHNATVKCTTCHSHDQNFRGAGGNNVEQFFDNAYNPFSAANYNDVSRHPLRTDNVLQYPTEVDCYTCHGVTGTSRRNNECLTCHWENRPSSGTPQHPNGVFEWVIPRTGAQYGTSTGTASVPDGFCMQCHGGSADNAALAGVAPLNIVPAGETWTGGSGHGATSSLSGGSAGPPAYRCTDCHYSTAVRTSGQSRDTQAPGVHASVNRKLVRNDNATAEEYPHPSSVTLATVDARSTRMDDFCSARCHGNAGNGLAKDDNVADHAWSPIAGQIKTGGQTHPSNMAGTPNARFRNPANLPLSEYLSGALPGSGNEICTTCHNPHGGGSVVDGSGASLTGGAKQMLRESWKDTNSTLCKECHL